MASIARISTRSRSRSALVTARTICFPIFVAIWSLWEAAAQSEDNRFDPVEGATRPWEFGGEDREPRGNRQPTWPGNCEHHDSRQQHAETSDDSDEARHSIPWTRTVRARDVAASSNENKCVSSAVPEFRRLASTRVW